MQIRYDMVSCFVLRSSPAGGAHEVLQIRRQAGDFLGGTWQTVSGRIERDETAVQAALRELREETGLIPLEFFQLDPVHIFYIAAHDTLWHCVQFCALLGHSDAVVLNEEHDEFRWIAFEDAARQFMWPGDRNALLEIHREILSGGLARQYMRIEL